MEFLYKNAVILVLTYCCITESLNAQLNSSARNVSVGDLLDGIFPEIEELMFGGYQTHTEVTFLRTNETLFTEEYHDIRKGKGFFKSGLGANIHYYNDTNQMVEVKGHTCNVTTIPYGEKISAVAPWYNVENAILGYSSILWRQLKAKFQVKLPIRGIFCSKFYVRDDVGKADIEYYFSVSDWLPAIGKKISTPVRVVVKFDAGSEYSDVQIDFTFWDPTVPKASIFNIPLGIGCIGLKSPKTVTVPSPEERFSFVLEVYNEFDWDNHVDTTINTYKVWYDNQAAMVRYDVSYNVSESVKPLTEVVDFVTGVAYIIYDTGKCLIKPINASAAETNSQIKAMKNPRELLNMDGAEFYYVGKDVQRGIDCDIWESVKSNLTSGIHLLDRVVLTFYFSSANVEESADGDEISEVPVTLMVTVYNEGSSKPVAYMANNFFRFDEADGRPFHEFMNVQNCFTAETQRSYFTINFKPPERVNMTVVKSKHQEFQLRALMTIAGSVETRPFRFPYFKVFYEQDKIIVLGLLINRPSYLTGFFLDSRGKQNLLFARGSRNYAEEASSEACAKNCFENSTMKCRSFKVCGGQCSLSEEASGFPGADPLCSMFIRSVDATAIKDKSIDDVLTDLELQVLGGSLVVEIEGLNFLATDIHVGVHPFNLDEHGIMYESVFNDFLLAKDGKYSFEDRSNSTNALDCYRACEEETDISCSSFSFCLPTLTCRLSSLYLKVGDDTSRNEVEEATNCNVYRRKTLQFYNLNIGKLPKIDGYNVVPSVHTTEECSTICKNDPNCKSFEYCDSVFTCTFHTTRELNILNSKDISSSGCRHYSAKYSSDFELFGDNMILVDPDKRVYPSMDLETCARLCSDTSAESNSCKSFNYCWNDKGEKLMNECQINKLSDISAGTVDTVKNCQHYFAKPSTDVRPTVNPDEKVFPSLKDMTANGFTAHVESKTSDIPNVFINEYHDLKQRRGRVDYVGTQLYYFKKTNQSVAINNGKCLVNRKEDTPLTSAFMWGWDEHRDVFGPSAILLRETFDVPKWVNQTTIRGIQCEMFEGKDKQNSNIILSYCFTGTNWENPSSSAKRIPVFVGVRGTDKDNLPVDVNMHITSFKPGEIHDFMFMIPRGLGCEGLTVTGNRQIPNVTDQYSFVIEDFIKTENKGHNEVLVYQLWYDYLGRTMKIIGTENSNPVSEIYDYNTGIRYRTNIFSRCIIEPITQPFTTKQTARLTHDMKTPNEMAALDGDYYYLGQSLYRSITCNVWESVKKNFIVGNRVYGKVVFTYYLSMGKIESVSAGDSNLEIPVGMQISVYPEETGELEKMLEFSYFRFDEPEDPSYSDVMNIDNCFPEDFQRQYFTVSFKATQLDVELAKRKHKEFLSLAVLAIRETGRISPLRLSTPKAYYEHESILVQGLILESAPIMKGFYEPKDNETYPTKGTSKVISTKNAEECAENCFALDNPKCTGFTLCQTSDANKKDCYLTNKVDTRDWGVMLPKETCKVYIKAIIRETAEDAPLNDAINDLETATRNGKLVVDMLDDTLVVNKLGTYTATKFESNSKPFGFHDSENYEGVQSDFQLKVSSQTTIELSDNIVSPRECYDRCLKESNLACAAFSFCSTTHKCRLTSIYVGKTNVDEVENATSCKVYRKQAIQFFEEFPGNFVTVDTKENRLDILDGIVAPEDCAFNCREQKLDCRSFDYCDNTQTCILNKEHVLDNPKLIGKSLTCKHYSLKYSTEFGNLGKDVVVDPLSVKIEAATFEECAKSCFLNEQLVCRSVNYCPAAGKNQAYCEINTRNTLDKDVVTIISESCQHYYRLDTVLIPPSPESKTQLTAADNSKRVSNGSFAAALICMLIVGIMLGVFGFIAYSRYRSRKLDSGGVSVRFINTRD